MGLAKIGVENCHPVEKVGLVNSCLETFRKGSLNAASCCNIDTNTACYGSNRIGRQCDASGWVTECYNDCRLHNLLWGVLCCTLSQDSIDEHPKNHGISLESNGQGKYFLQFMAKETPLLHFPWLLSEADLLRSLLPYILHPKDHP